MEQVSVACAVAEAWQHLNRYESREFYDALTYGDPTTVERVLKGKPIEERFVQVLIAEAVSNEMVSK